MLGVGCEQRGREPPCLHGKPSAGAQWAPLAGGPPGCISLPRGTPEMPCKQISSQLFPMARPRISKQEAHVCACPPFPPSPTLYTLQNIKLPSLQSLKAKLPALPGKKTAAA